MNYPPIRLNSFDAYNRNAIAGAETISGIPPRGAVMQSGAPRITIACFTDVHAPGGGATRAGKMACSLAARSHNVRILSLVNRDDNHDRDSFRGIPVKCFTLNSGRAWRMPQLLLKRQMRHVLSQEIFEPDVLLAVSPFFIPAARHVWPDVRIVFLFPCLLWRCLPKEWLARPKTWARLNHWLVGRHERHALEQADTVVVQSASVVEDILDFHPHCRDKLRVVPTGVDDLTAQVRRAPADVRKALATPPDALVLLSVGHLGANKNVEHVVQSLAVSRRRDLWFWIVGEGGRKGAIEKQVEALGLQEQVRFLGRRDDLPDVYCAANALIHAAWYDNFPNIYLEAMVSGLPLIGPRGAFPEVISPLDRIIRDGHEGWTYDLRDPGALAAILRSPELRQERLREMGRTARDLALRDYSWRRYVEAVERAMED